MDDKSSRESAKRSTDQQTVDAKTTSDNKQGEGKAFQEYSKDTAQDVEANIKRINNKDDQQS